MAIDYDKLWVHSVALQEIHIKDQFGVTHDVRSFPITNESLSGMGWDAPTQTLWITTPADRGVRRIDTDTGQVLSTRGWDADLQPPHSVHRDGIYLWIATANWVYRYVIPYDPVAPPPGILSAESFRHPIIWAKVRNPGDLW